MVLRDGGVPKASVSDCGHIRDGKTKRGEGVVMVGDAEYVLLCQVCWEYVKASVLEEVLTTALKAAILEGGVAVLASKSVRGDEGAQGAQNE